MIRIEDQNYSALKGPDAARAMAELMEYSKDYTKTADDFYRDREALVEDYRGFISEKASRMMESDYYKRTYLTPDDFDEMTSAMCAKFRQRTKRKPQIVLIEELRTIAKRLRTGRLKPFRKDMVLYRTALTDQMYHHLRSLSMRLLGGSEAIPPVQQAELVHMLVSSEMEELKEHGFQ